MRETSLAASTLLPVDGSLAAALIVLLVLAATVAAVFRLAPDGSWRRARDIVLAGVRAAVQLAVVALVIGWVVRHGAALLGFLLVMGTVAAVTAGRRVTRARGWGLAWAAVPIALPVAPIVGALVLSGLLPMRGIALIPVTGILIGGAMTATVLAGRRALDELTLRKGEVEACLSLGLLPREARLEIARPAASEALLPGLDQTRTVGLVTLPGAFVGMLLGGASPVSAGAVQLFVLVALMAVQAIAVAATVELVARGRLHRPGP
ncbi:ABC transporter permease [Streptomyces xanthii]|uniref:ABC transporter permease n=1 Tax=Streptomyces xanthii TaxID=2768069 RepID=A0A7H1B1C5_9ACTN|nr:ABC transporter permease [Streptomyces xanthii]QNS02530.1 ABC transporter permease [Streptomyces xanthii]